MVDNGAIICPNGHEIPVDARAVRFCRTCGSALLKKCPVGHMSPASGTFCATCGASMTDSSSEPTTQTFSSPVIASTPESDVTQVVPAPTASVVVAPEGGTPTPERDETRPTPIIASAPAPNSGATRGERRLGGPWLIVAIVAAVLVLALGATLVFVLRSRHPSANDAASTVTTETSHLSTRQTTTTTTPPSSTTTSAPSVGLAAQTLSGLLSQSVADRSSINAASDDVTSCGPNLSQDQQVFATAASSRQSLISQVSSNHSLSALPGLMILSLTGAWQASEQVDQDYASWASDEVTDGCTPNDTADPNYQAAVGPNQTATQDKMAFASSWDSIATTYNLPTYQWNQL